MQGGADDDYVCLSLVSRHQLQCLLHYLLSEDEFLSAYGIRSLSKVSAAISCLLLHFHSLLLQSMLVSAIIVYASATVNQCQRCQLLFLVDFRFYSLLL